MVLCHLKRLRAKVALLQETHLVKEDFICMQCLWVGKVVASLAVGDKAGVLVLIHKHLPWDILDQTWNDKRASVLLQ